MGRETRFEWRDSVSKEDEGDDDSCNTDDDGDHADDEEGFGDEGVELVE